MRVLKIYFFNHAYAFVSNFPCLHLQRDCGRPPVPRKDPGSKPEEEPLLSDHPYVDKVCFLQGIPEFSVLDINAVKLLFSINTKGQMRTHNMLHNYGKSQT